MKTIIRKKEDTDKDKNIIITKQGDNIQRSGVLSIAQEKMLLERSGKILAKTINKNVEEIKEDIVKQKNTKEVLDLYDEKRTLEKNIKENKDKIENLKQEQKELLKQIETE